MTEALGRIYYEERSVNDEVPCVDATGMSRIGYEPHRVFTVEGAVTVQVPQVPETEKVFQSQILDRLREPYRETR